MIILLGWLSEGLELGNRLRLLQLGGAVHMRNDIGYPIL
jgi:hypothetical protein